MFPLFAPSIRNGAQDEFSALYLELFEMAPSQTLIMINKMSLYLKSFMFPLFAPSIRNDAQSSQAF